MGWAPRQAGICEKMHCFRSNDYYYYYNNNNKDQQKKQKQQRLKQKN